MSDKPSPGTMLAGEIIAHSTTTTMALVVLVFGTDEGMIAVDYGTADRAMPPACAAQEPAVRTMLEGIRDDVHTRIEAFHAAHRYMIRVNRGPRGDA